MTHNPTLPRTFGTRSVGEPFGLAGPVTKPSFLKRPSLVASRQDSPPASVGAPLRV